MDSHEPLLGSRLPVLGGELHNAVVTQTGELDAGPVLPNASMARKWLKQVVVPHGASQALMPAQVEATPDP